MSDLAVADVDASHLDFAERLGLLLNFANSIILSDALKHQRAATAAPGATTAETVKAEFLRVQGHLVETIVRSCTPGATGTRIKWPALKADTAPISYAPFSYEPFQRFYLAHQRDIDASARGLRTTVRDAMTGVSARLDQLVALDIALEDTLWDHSRRFFSVIPRFLEKRFTHLQDTQQQTHNSKPPADGVVSVVASVQSLAWQQQFCRETQALLLAELEARLQPVIGLIEALDNEVNSKQ